MDNPWILLGAGEFAGLRGHETSVSSKRLTHFGVSIQFLIHCLFHLLVVTQTDQETAALNQTASVGTTQL